MTDISKNTQLQQSYITKVITRFFRNRRLKQYTKLKSICKYYEIEITDSLFGRFGGTFKNLNTYIVLARNHREAVERLRKRGVSLGLNFNGEQRVEKWARYKVRDLKKPNTFHHIIWF